ncbi:MAG TPA: DUF5916 domain-containing protein [Gemmatimonadaceae bacterium]
MRTYCSLFAAGLAAFLVSDVARAQTIAATGASGPRTGTAAVVTKAPVIDGRLDDEVWKSGQAYGDFIQRELRESEPVTERTEVRLLTDGEALYVGAWLFDREPAGIVPGEKIRDVTLTNSDYFALILDTYLDRQNGFVFATTPAGVEYDAQVVKEGEGGGVFQQGQTRAQAGSMGGFNLNWDATWQVATSIDERGWYAEFRIPFSTLRYGGGTTQDWGLNFVRSIRRHNEEAFWSFIPRQFNLYRLSRAGTLQGISVPSRRIATVTPYVLSQSARNFSVDSRMKSTGEFGVDMKYGLTPSLTLDLTYNTDFAQVEVDEQRTNLTRFPLFFPEKRPFFLENAGVFSAGTPQAVDLFFTRRIGIDTSGNPVPIIGGGRVSGRMGAATVGLLQIFTDETANADAQSFSVGRVSREFNGRSRIGAIAVQRQSTDEGDDVNRTYGIDGRIGVGEAWTVDWWGARTHTPTRTGDEYGYSVRAGYQTSRWNNAVRYVQVGEDFNPEVGFLNRFGGYRFYDISFMRTVRKREWAWMKQWNPHTNYRGYYSHDGFWQSGQIHVDMTELEFARGGRFGPEYNFYHEGLRQPFTIATGVVLPAGDYNWGSLGLDWDSDASAPLSFTSRSEIGPFYSGSRLGGTVNVTYRRGASLTTSVQLDYQDVSLAQGDFIRRLVGVKVGYFFTPKVFLQSLVQYNNQAKVWTANARFGWLSTAGTGLFIVYNEGQQAGGFFDWIQPQSRSVVVKYTKQLGG